MAILGGKSPFFRPALSMSDLSTCQRPATLPFWEVLKLQLKVSEDYLHDLGALTRSPSGTKIIKQTAIRLKVQCIFMSVYLSISISVSTFTYTCTSTCTYAFTYTLAYMIIYVYMQT